MRPEPAGLVGDLVDRAGVGIALVDDRRRYRYVNPRLAAINGRTVDEHLGRTLREVVPDIAAVVEPLVDRVLGGEPVVTTTVEGSTTALRTAHWQATYLPVALDDGEPGVGILVIDVSDRQNAMAETRRRLAQQGALAALGQRALAGASLDELLQAATDMLARELGADLAGILQFADSREDLWMRTGTGFPAGAVGRIRSGVGVQSQAGFTLLVDDAVLTVDSATEDRFTFSKHLLDLGVRSAISVPIPGPNAPFGVLGVLARDPARFDEDDANVLRATANVLGAAVVREAQEHALERLAAQRGRLVAQALDAAEFEQRRVADVLHDDVLQHLLFARLELRGLTPGSAAIERVEASIEAATTLLRRVIGGLHPVTLAHAGLSPAIESLTAEFRARTGLQTEVRVAEGLPADHDRLIVGIVRELLNNIVKHSGATRAAIHVLGGPDAVVVHVAADGLGMEPDAFERALGRGNIGLANARERVAALGGSTAVGAGLGGRGAGVTIRLPR